MSGACYRPSLHCSILRDPHAQPLFILLLAAFTYLGCSALAHLLSAKSELSHYTFYFLDYVGVAVYQYGSALAHFYYVVEEEWHAQVRSFFLPASAFLAWLSCTGCCYGKYASPSLPKFVHKLFQVVPSGLAYCLDISPVNCSLALLGGYCVSIPRVYNLTKFTSSIEG